MDRVVSSHPPRLLRLAEVLHRVLVGKSSWWNGVREGRFPQPVKLGPRTTAWREADIDALIVSLRKEGGAV